MYWTDLLDGIVRSINKTSGEITILADDLDIVLDIEVYSRDRPRPGESHDMHSVITVITSLSSGFPFL
jgi:hypothetical protein